MKKIFIAFSLLITCILTACGSIEKESKDVSSDMVIQIEEDENEKKLDHDLSLNSSDNENQKIFDEPSSDNDDEININ